MAQENKRFGDKGQRKGLLPLRALQNMPDNTRGLSRQALIKYRAKLWKEFERMRMMEDVKLQQRVQKYLNIYRNVSAKYLPIEIGQEIKVVGFNNGVLVNIHSAPLISNTDNFYLDVDTIVEALNTLKIQFNNSSKYIKQIENNKRPTNGTYIGFDETIIIIKGKESKFWTVEQVFDDIDVILKEVEASILEDNTKKTKKNNIKNDKKGSY